MHILSILKKRPLVAVGWACVGLGFGSFVALRLNGTGQPSPAPVSPRAYVNHLMAYYFTRPSEAQVRLRWCAAHSPIPRPWVLACETALSAQSAKRELVDRFERDPKSEQFALDGCRLYSADEMLPLEDPSCASAMVVRALLNQDGHS
jgi:hypothetical protein